MPARVRKAPLSERIQAHLDPYDLLLWLSELLNDDTFEEWLKGWATPIGVGMNIVFIIARAASKPGSSSGYDDVFGSSDLDGRGGWLSWLAAFLVHLLTLFCCWNALATFMRKRHYRLFEQPVDEPPATPSAQRVRVDSSPASSPLQYLKNVVSSATATTRAYPDPEREVWQLSVWDPKPFQLTLFTLFSPGHVLLYYALLPPTPQNPRPSVAVFTAVLFGALLSLQLAYLKSSFSQQAKDSTLVHGEVMHEYDTKFVRPSLNRPVRDVGIQTRESTLSPRGTRTREVDIYTPTTIINRGFRTNPNPNYASQYDPDDLASSRPTPSRRTSDISFTTPSLTTPANAYSQTNPGTTTSTYRSAATTPYSRQSTGGASTAADFSSPLKAHHSHRPAEPARHRSAGGDGGSMGVYSHAASPLRKAASANHLTGRLEGGGSSSSSHHRPGSPLKRVSTPGDVGGGGAFARRRDTGRM
ncbi:hypothetical protein BDY17DRAFT_292724 [Neohortaea acidophila]|uniref:Nuclear rim protein 1 n=1 Tax=Neohortaea acidophila TaxID=245834 RepID=A0A6A6PZX8_9PEZI|nr:uncharacterized protein BDY17DRAFT_292724 [Neohortaea acidophila]KAF2484993.1 hypothetical protein BDY17DRAFT_292724 [Neohortaea acidophila]